MKQGVVPGRLVILTDPGYETYKTFINVSVKTGIVLKHLTKWITLLDNYNCTFGSQRIGDVQLINYKINSIKVTFFSKITVIGILKKKITTILED